MSSKKKMSKEDDKETTEALKNLKHIFNVKWKTFKKPEKDLTIKYSPMKCQGMIAVIAKRVGSLTKMEYNILKVILLYILDCNGFLTKERIKDYAKRVVHGLLKIKEDDYSNSTLLYLFNVIEFEYSHRFTSEKNLSMIMTKLDKHKKFLDYKNNFFEYFLFYYYKTVLAFLINDMTLCRSCLTEEIFLKMEMSGEKANKYTQMLREILTLKINLRDKENYDNENLALISSLTEQIPETNISFIKIINIRGNIFFNQFNFESSARDFEFILSNKLTFQTVTKNVRFYLSLYTKLSQCYLMLEDKDNFERIKRKIKKILDYLKEDSKSCPEEEPQEEDDGSSSEEDSKEENNIFFSKEEIEKEKQKIYKKYLLLQFILEGKPFDKNTNNESAYDFNQTVSDDISRNLIILNALKNPTTDVDKVHKEIKALYSKLTQAKPDSKEMTEIIKSIVNYLVQEYNQWSTELGASSIYEDLRSSKKKLSTKVKDKILLMRKDTEFLSDICLKLFGFNSKYLYNFVKTPFFQGLFIKIFFFYAISYFITENNYDETEEKIKEFEKNTEIDKNNGSYPLISKLKGDIEFQKKNYENARNEYKKALELNEKHQLCDQGTLYFNIGVSSALLKERKESTLYLHKAFYEFSKDEESQMKMNTTENLLKILYGEQK